MKPQRIFIDATDFLTWSGHFTGIQRTFYSIVVELQKKHSNVQLIVYAEGKYQLLHQNIQSIAKDGVKKRRQRPVLTKAERFKRQVGQIYRNMPQYFRVPTMPVMLVSKYGFKRLTPVGYSLLHRIRLARSALGINNHELSTRQHIQRNLYGPTALIDQQDTLLVLSCIWDSYEHLGFLADLVATKKPTFHCLVYDLIPVYASQVFGDGLTDIYARYVFEVLTLANTVFAISEATADDLRKFMHDTGITRNVDIQTLRLGDTIPVKISKELHSSMLARYKKPFAITVGTIEARKNHVQLYAALKLAVKEKKIDRLPHIYIIGRTGWLASEIAHFLSFDPQMKNRITILNDVSDEELAWFYKNAEFSIYTSQYEGWGLPVAESFVNGTPCIVSNASSMKEISPDISKFVSPFDNRELLDALLEYSDSAVVTAQRKKISQTYKPTTWAETIKPLLEVLRRKQQ